MAPPKGYGGVEIPSLRRAKQHSQSEDTPPSDNVRDTIRLEQEARLNFRKEMEALATSTKEEARQAASKSQAVDWKLNLLIGLMGTAIVMAISAFAWLFSLQQESDKNTVKTASREARLVVLEQDRNFEAKAIEIAQKAVRLDREERARDAMTVVARTTK